MSEKKSLFGGFSKILKGKKEKTEEKRKINKNREIENESADKAEKETACRGKTNAETIVTDLDRLLAMVKEEKEVNETNAMKRLNISKKQLTQYADILKEQGLIEVKYKAMNGMKIKYKDECKI